jgi:hypothetical protein
MTALTSQYPTIEYSSMASTIGHLLRFQGTGIPGSVEQTATKVPLGMDAPTEPRKTKRPLVPWMKTGCITCRQRKKKCDEAKPHCNNCKRGNLQCGGYREKVPWRGRLTSPARKRETPLIEMSQLDAHLNLSHTLLDVFSRRESIIHTLLPLLPRCSRRNQGVVAKLLRQAEVHLTRR